LAVEIIKALPKSNAAQAIQRQPPAIAPRQAAG
jgi:hypothetical protein